MPRYEYYYSDDDSLDENNDNNNPELDEEHDRLYNKYTNFRNYLNENNFTILDKLSYDTYINYL